LRRNKLIPVFLFLLLFAVVGYLSLTSTAYLSVSDLKQIKNPTRVAVMGNVSKGSVRFAGELEFVITDGKSEVKVIYPTWIQLDNVSGYGKVVVEGIYYPELNTIKAERIQTKCPSKEEIEIYSKKYASKEQSK